MSTRKNLGGMATAVLLFALLLCIPQQAFAQSYWFEQYIRVVSLIDGDNWQQAEPLLDALIEAHPSPMTKLRITGTRVIDYAPYYQRARIQLLKGNPTGALHNLDVSRAFGAHRSSHQINSGIKRIRREALQLRALQRQRIGRGPTRSPATLPISLRSQE